MSKKILISGFSYAYPYYFKVFEYFKNKESLIFILPKLWIARQGKIRLKLEKKPDFNIIGARAVSYGGQSLFWKLGGLLKGFMPMALLYIPYLKFTKKVKVYYHISEPHLLTTFLNALTAKIFGLKYICFTWQNLEPEARISGTKLKLSNFFTWLNLSLSDAIMCGSLMSEQVIKKIKPSMKTIQIQMAGVDTERFKPSFVEKQSDEQIVLFFGALDERKGVDVLIKAFDKIKNDFPKAKLVIIGSGFIEDKLHKLADDLRLGDRIEWKSWMKNEELPNFIVKADIFVYLSRRAGGWIEQYGYAIMQASAAGLPVVSTNNGSIYEVIVDGKSGILVETDNVEQTAQAIAKILGNQELGRQMGKFGHKYINEKFSNEVVANKIEKFLGSF